MLDGNVLLRQKRDEVPEGTLSCPDRNLAVFHHCRRYEGLRLLPSVCEQIIIQQTLIDCVGILNYYVVVAGCCETLCHLRYLYHSNTKEKYNSLVLFYILVRTNLPLSH